MLSIYLSGASKEHERAHKWAAKLAALPNVRLVSTWHRSAGTWHGQDARLPLQDQRNIAQVDLGAVYSASLVWLLMPNAPSVGAFVELGYAISHRRPIIVSGPGCDSSIFTSLSSSRFHDDDDAWLSILRLSLSEAQPMQPVGGLS